MITRDFREASRRDIYRILTSLIIPRAIAWIATANEDGSVNLAPFSSFMGIFNPPAAAVTFGRHKDGRLKDTHRNIRDRGEAVVHIADEPFLEVLHACGDAVDYGISEPARLGLATAPSDLVAPPRIVDAPVALECRFREEHSLGEQSTLVLLDVIRAHARDGIWRDDLDCADGSLWTPLARLGSVAGPNYGVLGRRFTLDKPKLP